MGNDFLRQQAMKRGQAIAYFFIIILQSSALFSFQNQPPQLRPDLRQSLRLLDESWCILDRMSEKLWPGWNSYKQEAAYFGIPKIQDVLVNITDEPPKGFQLIDLKVHQKPIYLRSPNPLESAHGGINVTIEDKRYRLVSMRAKTAKDESMNLESWKRVLETPDIPAYIEKVNRSCEYYISSIIHESFHLFQIKNRKSRGGAREPTDFLDVDQAAYSLLEGKILNEALFIQDTDETRELTKQFLAVRQHRREKLNASNIVWEQEEEWSEGSATYVMTKVLMLLDETNYKPRVLKSGEKDFFDFKIWEDVLKFTSQTLLSAARTLDMPLQKCYYYGLVQGLILDRICGDEWKREFFNDNEYFETLLERYSGYDDNADRAICLEKAKAYYDFGHGLEEMKKKVDEKKAFIDRILRAKGKKYKIDLISKIPKEKLKSRRLVALRRSGVVSCSEGTIVLEGYEKIGMGSGMLITEKMPFFEPRNTLLNIEWIDTENLDFKKDYDLTWASQEGNIYTDVVFKTRGFRYTAHKAEIVDRGEVVEIYTLE